MSVEGDLSEAMRLQEPITMDANANTWTKTDLDRATAERLDSFKAVLSALDAVKLAFERPIPRNPDGARLYWDRLREARDDLDEALIDYGMRD